MGNVVSCKKILQSLMIARFLDSFWWGIDTLGHEMHMITLIFTEPSQYIIHVSSPHSYFTCETCVYIFRYLNTHIHYITLTGMKRQLLYTYILQCICDMWIIICCHAGLPVINQEKHSVTLPWSPWRIIAENRMKWCNLMLYVWM